MANPDLFKSPESFLKTGKLYFYEYAVYLTRDENSKTFLLPAKTVFLYLGEGKFFVDQNIYKKHALIHSRLNELHEFKGHFKMPSF